MLKQRDYEIQRERVPLKELLKEKARHQKWKAVGKLPPTFKPRSSTEGESDVPIADKRNIVKNRAFYDRTWELLQKILIDFGTTMGNLNGL